MGSFLPKLRWASRGSDVDSVLPLLVRQQVQRLPPQRNIRHAARQRHGAVDLFRNAEWRVCPGQPDHAWIEHSGSCRTRASVLVTSLPSKSERPFQVGAFLSKKSWANKIRIVYA